MRFKKLLVLFLSFIAIAHAEPQDSSFRKHINDLKHFFSRTPKAAESAPAEIQPPVTTPPAAPVEPMVQAQPESAEFVDLQTDNSPQGHFWNLQETDIRAVIQEVSKMTGKNFLIDPRVQGKVSLISNSKISDKDIYPMFLLPVGPY